MKLPCFKDLLPVPHGQKSHLLSKTHEALDSLNPSFLFCFYQSTHITYPLVTLELFTIPWPSQILSRLFCLLCLCTNCSFCLECLSCLLCRQNAPLPLRSRSFHSSQLKPFFFGRPSPPLFTISISSLLPNHITYSSIIAISSLCYNLTAHMALLSWVPQGQGTCFIPLCVPGA